jgi:hypothetical protein
MASSINNVVWIEWMTGLMGGVSRQTHAATFPPDRFYCLLDELPLHLVPQRARRSLRQDQGLEQPLYLNPDCILCSGDEIPEELLGRRELLRGLALQGTVAWVRNATSSVPLPFWLGPRFESLLCDLRLNEPVPASLPDNARQVLLAAGILVSEEQAEKTDLRDESLRKASLEFQQKGYAPLGDLIHPFHIAALRRYYRYLIRTGVVALGDRQSERRYVAHNEPVARFFHHQIAPTLSALAGEAIKPSYVYMASYLSGAELKKHVDRAQCEFSLTMCLDFCPEPALATPWPIQLQTPTGTVTVYQALGDALAYRGTRLPHYRGRLGQGQTSTSIFFHYVAADFEGPLE